MEEKNKVLDELPTLDLKNGEISKVSSSNSVSGKGDTSNKIKEDNKDEELETLFFSLDEKNDESVSNNDKNNNTLDEKKEVKENVDEIKKVSVETEKKLEKKTNLISEDNKPNIVFKDDIKKEENPAEISKPIIPVKTEETQKPSAPAKQTGYRPSLDKILGTEVKKESTATVAKPSLEANKQSSMVKPSMQTKTGVGAKPNAPVKQTGYRPSLDKILGTEIKKESTATVAKPSLEANKPSSMVKPSSESISKEGIHSTSSILTSGDKAKLETSQVKKDESNKTNSVVKPLEVKKESTATIAKPSLEANKQSSMVKPSGESISKEGIHSTSSVLTPNDKAKLETSQVKKDESNKTKSVVKPLEVKKEEPVNEFASKQIIENKNIEKTTELNLNKDNKKVEENNNDLKNKKDTLNLELIDDKDNEKDIDNSFLEIPIKTNEDNDKTNDETKKQEIKNQEIKIANNDTKHEETKPSKIDSNQSLEIQPINISSEYQIPGMNLPFNSPVIFIQNPNSLNYLPNMIPSPQIITPQAQQINEQNGIQVIPQIQPISNVQTPIIPQVQPVQPAQTVISNVPQVQPIQPVQPIIPNVPQVQPIQPVQPVIPNVPQVQPIQSVQPIIPNVPQVQPIQSVQPIIPNVPQVQPVSNVVAVPVEQNNQSLQNLPNVNNVNTKLNTFNNTNIGKPVSDETLLKEYIGNNYYKITKRKINFAAFFLNSIYLFFRKMPVLGLIIFIVEMVILNLSNQPIILLVLFLFLSIVVNKLYVSKSFRKIKKLRAKNSDDQFTLRRVCAKKGGTNFGYAFFGLLFEVGFIFFLVFYGYGTNMTKYLGKLGISLNITDSILKVEFLKDVNNNPQSFNGLLITDTSVNVFDEFDIKIPEVFNSNIFNDTYRVSYEYFDNKKTNNTCSLKLESIKRYNSSQKLISQMAKYYNTSVLPVREGWENIKVSNSNGTTYYYATNKEDKVYLFTYGIENNAPLDC